MSYSILTTMPVTGIFIIYYKKKSEELNSKSQKPEFNQEKQMSDAYQQLRQWRFAAIILVNHN